MCGRCGRRTYAVSMFHRMDMFTQPDDYPCGGTFDKVYGMSFPLDANEVRPFHEPDAIWGPADYEDNEGDSDYGREQTR